MAATATKKRPKKAPAKKPKPRQHAVQVTLSDRELAWLEAIAEPQGLSRAAAFRALLHRTRQQELPLDGHKAEE